jgi:hypothetical protein
MKNYDRGFVSVEPRMMSEEKPMDIKRKQISWPTHGTKLQIMRNGVIHQVRKRLLNIN